MKRTTKLSIIAVLLLTANAQNLKAVDFIYEPSDSVIENYYKEQLELSYINNIPIKQEFITRNYLPRNTKPKYIIIHDTANSNSGADVYVHTRYYQNNTRGASAHYTVQDNVIMQNVRDTDTAWHVGDKPNPVVNNTNTIAIEMTVHPESDFTKTLENTKNLTLELMRKYDIPPENVLRHFDVTGKPCSRKLIDNPDLWVKFKHSIGDKTENFPLPIDKGATDVKTGKTIPVLASDDISLQQEPNWNSKKLDTILENSEIELIEQINNQWSKVSVNGEIGYTPTNKLIELDNLVETKIKNVTPLLEKSNLNSKVIDMLEVNEVVRVVHKDEYWSRVITGKSYGFIETKHLTIED